MAEFCLKCLQQFEPNANEQNVVLTKEPNKCDGCGENKQIVHSFGDNKFIPVVGGTSFRGFFNDVSDLDITLRMLVNDLGWVKVRDFPIYIDTENSEPLAFKNTDEYSPYLEYKVKRLGTPIIISEN